MPWLTVLGTGQWGYGHPTGNPKTNPRGELMLDAKGNQLPEVVIRNFAAGTHEVDDETAEHARSAGIDTLIITEVRPIIVKRDPHGPLSWEDIRLPMDGGVYLVPAEEDEAPTESPLTAPLDYPCGSCEKRFPSQGARDRHREFHHAKPG